MAAKSSRRKDCVYTFRVLKFMGNVYFLDIYYLLVITSELLVNWSEKKVHAIRIISSTQFSSRQ